MKKNQIVELSKEDFIKELKRPNSRVAHMPLYWTAEWLKNHGLAYKSLLKAQNHIYAETAELQAQAHEADINDCLKALGA